MIKTNSLNLTLGLTLEKLQEKELKMAFKAIACFRGEGAEAKRSIGNVAIDGIATRRGQADPFGPTTAGAQCTYLEASQLSPALIHHHHLHGSCTTICLLIMKIKKIELQISKH